MDKIYFSIIKGALELTEAPAFSPSRPFLQKGLRLLRSKLPGLIKHIEKARGIAHINRLEPVFNGSQQNRKKLAELVKNWRSREGRRLLMLFILEVLILPVSILFALVPGPNIFGYLVVILLWFHFPALMGIYRIKPENLTDQLLKSDEKALETGARI